MYDSAAMGIIGGDGPAIVYTWYGQFSFAVYVLIVAASAVAAYMLGNISPSIIMAKARGIDIKKAGSGNAGTTNALRVMGKKAGVITLIIDVLKGTAAVMIGYIAAGDIGAYVCAIAVFCGHVWPAFYRFKGGKGVATVFGALLGINVWLALSALGIVVIGVLISKRMSVGSILGAVCFPLIAFLLEPRFIIPGTALALAIIIKHKANISRLIRGEEPVMSIFDKKSKREQAEKADENEEETA